MRYVAFTGGATKVGTYGRQLHTPVPDDDSNEDGGLAMELWGEGTTREDAGNVAKLVGETASMEVAVVRMTAAFAGVLVKVRLSGALR